ncbi:unnamed protein product [Cuscuta campestris]|uniref:Uncharacterized protein n=1 Tax=Cuscuta campestris TaxID=132261 RepID=A0A484NNA6_9ASTE|nr:unnamed protein product [Cuscuta campestris]
MAEARREIVTALKFHRAAKKQHRQQEQEQEQPRRAEEEEDRLVLPLPPPRPRRPSEQEPSLCSSWVVNGFSDIAPAGFRSPCLFFPPPPPPPPPPLFQESLDFPLPNQTLGLNLNFQGFDHLDASPYLPSCNNPSSIHQSSSSSNNYCSVSSGLHRYPSLDEREISEMKSMGEKHQMEWNDSMNLETSALWLEFLETMGEEKKGGEEDGYYGCYHPFDEAMEFPGWLNGGDDESCLEHDLNVNFSDDFCFQNPAALPCIEEIQGNEVEWLTGED